MSETKNVYALFVGIDQFANGNIPPLGGCANDARYMLEYLREWAGERNFPLHAVELYDADATRSNILLQFQKHLFQARKGDIAFFFLASHGSTEVAHPYFEENGNLVNTIVCYDSRSKGADGKTIRDIMDKEMRYLIRQLWEKTEAEIVLVQDTCHSGGATRSLGENPERALEDQGDAEKRAGQKARCYSASDGQRSLEEFLSVSQTANPDDAFVRLARGLQDTLRACVNVKSESSGGEGKSDQAKPPFNQACPEGNHIHFSGCMKHQYSYEGAQEGGIRGGNFTHALISVLRAHKGDIRYEDLQKEVVQKVLEKNLEQHPMFTGIYPKPGINKLRAHFLTTPPDEELLARYFEEVPLSYKEFRDTNSGQLIAQGWFMFMGGADTLKIVRKGLDTPLPVKVIEAGDARTGGQKEYSARIVAVLAEKSIVEFDGPEPNRNAKCRVLINETHRNIYRLRVAADESLAQALKDQPLNPDMIFAQLQAKLQTGNAQGMAQSPSFAVNRTEQAESARAVFVEKEDKSWELRLRDNSGVVESRTLGRDAVQHIFTFLSVELGRFAQSQGLQNVDLCIQANPFELPDALLQKSGYQHYGYHLQFTQSPDKSDCILRYARGHYEVVRRVKDKAGKINEALVIRLPIDKADTNAKLFDYLKRISVWETVRIFGNPNMSDDLKFVKVPSGTQGPSIVTTGSGSYDRNRLALQLFAEEFGYQKEEQGGMENADDPFNSGSFGSDSSTPVYKDTRTEHSVGLSGLDVQLLPPNPSKGIAVNNQLQAVLKFRVRNNSPHTLYIAALLLEDLYGIKLAANGAKATVEPGQELFLFAGDLPVTFPLRKCFEHLPHTTVYIKLIAGPSEFYSTSGFVQDNLPEPDTNFQRPDPGANRSVNTFGFNYGDWGAISYRITLHNPNYQG